MKKLLFFLFSTMFMHNLLAQQIVNNFSIENNKVIWQKVYDTSMSFEQLSKSVTESGLFENLVIDENKITGQLKIISADYKGAGYYEMTTPMYVVRSFFDGFVLIEYKDSKYRANFKNIMLTQKFDDPIVKQGSKTHIEFYALKRDKQNFASLFTKSASLILDYTFSKTFTFTMPDKNPDW